MLGSLTIWLPFKASEKIQQLVCMKQGILLSETTNEIGLPTSRMRNGERLYYPYSSSFGRRSLSVFRTQTETSLMVGHLIIQHDTTLILLATKLGLGRWRRLNYVSDDLREKFASAAFFNVVVFCFAFCYSTCSSNQAWAWSTRMT